jgi:hypothetical protein
MSFREALIERMQRPQRHRLLQGFPAVPAMRKAGPAAPIASLSQRTSRSIASER